MKGLSRSKHDIKPSNRISHKGGAKVSCVGSSLKGTVIIKCNRGASLAPDQLI
ncbi:hypothetical protein V3C99_010528, partial [Haemonchus contortus]